MRSARGNAADGPARPRLARAGRTPGRPRTKDLTKRMQLGEIAVINHADIDRVAAEGLIDAGVGAVLNAAPSITGRYPNGGPIRLVDAGILLVDDLGPDVMDRGRARASVAARRPDGAVWRGDEQIATGKVRGIADVTEADGGGAGRASARSSSGSRRTRSSTSARRPTITFEPLDLPPLDTKFAGRHAMVVVRGHDYQTDLDGAAARTSASTEPVLIGVDGGADALLDLGFKPDIIIGDFDSRVATGRSRCGAELVHHVHPDGRAPGRENLEAWAVGKEYLEFVAEGTSEDVAMLLAYEAGASLIVAVGTHATMVEFLDKGRRGMASTFLTRLRLGPMLVDAKGVQPPLRGPRAPA